MRLPIISFCLALAALGSCDSIGRAQVVDDSLAAARYEARCELEFAKLNSRHYWQVEYPRRRRALNAVIAQTELEVRAYKELGREYGPFDRFSTGRPLLVPLLDLKACLLDAEFRLEALRHERNNLVRFHSAEGRLLDLRVAEARRRVIALEGGEVIEIGVEVQ